MEITSTFWGCKGKFPTLKGGSQCWPEVVKVLNAPATIRESSVLSMVFGLLESKDCFANLMKGMAPLPRKTWTHTIYLLLKGIQNLLRFIHGPQIKNSCSNYIVHHSIMYLYLPHGTICLQSLLGGSSASLSSAWVEGLRFTSVLPGLSKLLALSRSPR